MSQQLSTLAKSRGFAYVGANPTLVYISGSTLYKSVSAGAEQLIVTLPDVLENPEVKNKTKVFLRTSGKAVIVYVTKGTNFLLKLLEIDINTGIVDKNITLAAESSFFDIIDKIAIDILSWDGSILHIAHSAVYNDGVDDWRNLTHSTYDGISITFVNRVELVAAAGAAIVNTGRVFSPNYDTILVGLNYYKLSDGSTIETIALNSDTDLLWKDSAYDEAIIVKNDSSVGDAIYSMYTSIGGFFDSYFIGSSSLTLTGISTTIYFSVSGDFTIFPRKKFAMLCMGLHLSVDLNTIWLVLRKEAAVGDDLIDIYSLDVSIAPSIARDLIFKKEFAKTPENSFSGIEMDSIGGILTGKNGTEDLIEYHLFQHNTSTTPSHFYEAITPPVTPTNALAFSQVVNGQRSIISNLKNTAKLRFLGFLGVVYNSKGVVTQPQDELYFLELGGIKLVPMHWFTLRAFSEDNNNDISLEVVVELPNVNIEVLFPFIGLSCRIYRKIGIVEKDVFNGSFNFVVPRKNKVKIFLSGSTIRTDRGVPFSDLYYIRDIAGVKTLRMPAFSNITVGDTIQNARGDFKVNKLTLHVSVNNSFLEVT